MAKFPGLGRSDRAEGGNLTKPALFYYLFQKDHPIRVCYIQNILYHNNSLK